MKYHVTNSGEHARRFGGAWVQPGESRVVEMAVLPQVVITNWRRGGVRIVPHVLAEIHGEGHAEVVEPVVADDPLPEQEATVEAWSEPEAQDGLTLDALHRRMTREVLQTEPEPKAAPKKSKRRKASDSNDA